MLDKYLEVLKDYGFKVKKTGESYTAVNKNHVEFSLTENEMWGIIEVEYGYNDLTLDLDDLKTIESSKFGEPFEDSDCDSLSELFEKTASILANYSENDL